MEVSVRYFSKCLNWLEALGKKWTNDGFPETERGRLDWTIQKLFSQFGRFEERYYGKRTEGEIYLTPAFMRDIAEKSAPVIWIDFRGIVNAQPLLNAYIDERARLGLDCNPLIVESDPHQLRKPACKNVALFDTTSDLNLSGISLKFEHIRKEIEAHPTVERVDLRDNPLLDLVELMQFEAKMKGVRPLRIKCTVPDEMVIDPRWRMSMDAKGLEALLKRFQFKSVDLTHMKLTAIDILFLKESFPQVTLLYQTPKRYEIALFDKKIIKRLAALFPDLEICLMHPDDKRDEIALLKEQEGLRNLTTQQSSSTDTSYSLSELVKKDEADDSRAFLSSKESGLENEEVRPSSFSNEAEQPPTQSVSRRGREAEEKMVKAASIHDAARNGDLSAVMRFLGDGVDVNAVDQRGKNSLHFAAVNGHVEVVKLLLQKGAKVDVYHEHVNTALGYASERGHIEIVELLLEAGADIEAANYPGNRPLCQASIHGHKDVVERLLARGAKVSSGYNDYQPLHYAALWGHTEIVRLLLDKGAKVNPQIYYGVQPLHVAMSSNNLELIKLLIERGAEIKAEDAKGLRPVHYAALNGSSDALKLLRERGADFSAKCRKGRSLLHYAAKSGSTDTVNFLLGCGFKFEVTDHWDKTPLQIAEEKGYEEVKDLLVKAGGE